MVEPEKVERRLKLNPTQVELYLRGDAAIKAAMQAQGQTVMAWLAVEGVAVNCDVLGLDDQTNELVLRMPGPAQNGNGRVAPQAKKRRRR